MENVYAKIKSFKDLIVWQQAHQLALEIYKATRSFPQEELYGLTSQIRRSAVSVTSNLAEGFSRKSPKEKIQFYHLSLGSLTELDNQITLAKDLNYLTPTKFTNLLSLLISVQKLLNRLISSTKERLSNP